MQNPFDTLLVGGTLVSPEIGELRAELGIIEGKIAAILDPGADVEARDRVDVSGAYVLPGVVDPHVHIGHGQAHSDDFFTETRSGAIGGVTTTLSYFRKEPYNYLDLVPALIEQGESNAVTDFGIHLVIGLDQHLEDLPKFIELGITSFKLFFGHQDHGILDVTSMAHTGAHIPIGDGYILRAFKELAKYPGTLAVAHCENSEINADALAEVKTNGITGLRGWSESRPDYSETEGLRRAAYWAELAGIPLYVVHVGSARTARELVRQRAGRELPIYAESLIQYQTLTYESELGALVKMNPPLRGPADRAELNQQLAAGTFDTISSDHGSFKADEKQDAFKGRSGTPSSGLILPGLLNGAYRRGEASLVDIARMTATNPANIFGIGRRKGSLRVGSDADIVVVDLERTRTVTPELMQSNADYSPFQGMEIKGWPVLSYRRGGLLMDDGELRAERGSGNYLRRELVTERGISR